MHEYIKKLSYSLCLIEQIIKDIKFKENIKDLEMSLIGRASDFLEFSGENISGSKLWDLRKILIQVVDLFDLAKVGNVVSVMNAEIIISASLRILEEVDEKLQKNNSFLLPKFSLSEIPDQLLRDKVREEQQNKFLNKSFAKSENEVFSFTKIPELKLSVSENISTDKKIKGEVKNNEPEFDWGNGQGKAEPMVYTFFGSEDKIIEDRKNKLLEILKAGGGSAIGDITKHFPGLNVKTLQRDLLDLMREKKVIMLGKKRWAKYYLK